MKTFIYINEDWPGQEEFGPMQWATIGKSGEVVHSSIAGKLEDIPIGQEYEVIVPSSVVYLASVEAPNKNVRLFLKSLPNVVEERISSSADNIHIASGKIQPDRNVPIAIIDKEWIAKALQKLSKAGIKLSAMRIETLEAPIENGYTAVLSSAGGFVRTGEHSGFNLDIAPSNSVPHSLKFAIKSAQSNGSALDCIDVFFADLSDRPDIDSWTDELGITVREMGKWDIMRNLNGGGNSINLLQGKFAPRSNIIESLPMLKPAAFMAVLALLMTLLLSWTEYHILSGEKQRLKGELVDIYKSTFPDAVNIINPKLQMSQKLNKLREKSGLKSKSDFTYMLGNIAPYIAVNAKLRNLSYRDGELKLALEFNNLVEFQIFKESLKDLTYSVDYSEPDKNKSGLQVWATIINKEL